nr:NADH deshydrogenase subunit 4L [Euceros serricornis]
MMSINFYLTIYLTFMSFLMLNCFFKHMLLFVITFEFIMLNIMYMLFNMSNYFNININIIIFFLIINVCESALSLSLIILLVRSHGNDYINSISMFVW